MNSIRFNVLLVLLVAILGMSTMTAGEKKDIANAKKFSLDGGMRKTNLRAHRNLPEEGEEGEEGT